jgi:hypothetical protein
MGVGSKTKLVQSEVEVEIARYLPDAQAGDGGTFVSKSDLPRNPMLELRVYVPGREEPMRQIAFANDPLLNLDGVYEQSCPVKFRYFHPLTKPPSGVDFMHAGGKLYARAAASGSYSEAREVKTGDKTRLPGNFAVTVDDYLPHGALHVTFEPAKVKPRDKQKPEPAALIEVVAGGRVQEVWLQRNSVSYGSRIVQTAEGPLALRLGMAKIPLGFTLSLLEFERGMNPGSAGSASFTSKVRISDNNRRVDRESVISMNQPLDYGKYTFYQSSFDDAGHGRQVSTLRVVHDPGRFLKYAGSLMICGGIAIMFYMRAYFFKHMRRSTKARDIAPLAPQCVSSVDALEVLRRAS